MAHVPRSPSIGATGARGKWWIVEEFLTSCPLLVGSRRLVAQEILHSAKKK